MDNAGWVWGAPHARSSSTSDLRPSALRVRLTELKEQVDVKVVYRIEPSAFHLLGLGLG
jgi:hypothetical protein